MAKFNEGNEKIPNGSSAYAVKISAANYFGKDGFEGYDNPTDFLSYGEKLTTSDEEQLRKCIAFIKEGLKTDGGSDIRKDVAGQQYQFYHFFKPKSRPGAKVVVSPSIVRLISDYQNGKITINFTLDDLIIEARKG
jgi:hypothetical protein